MLGPVEVWSQGGRLPLGGPKPRALLATLLLSHGRVVSTERLVDRVWGEAPPPTARALVQTYVSALRRAIGSDVLETRPPGYVLHAPAVAFDLAVFERLAGEGRDALTAGEPERASAQLRSALDLWRGAPLGGIGDALRADAHRLDELRLGALEDRAAADLALGRTTELLGELPSLVAYAPLRERLRHQLITVLYRVGRRADALATYHEGRRLLADELGIDPGPELRRLYESIIRADPASAAGGREQVREHAPMATPAQLPPQVADFTGHDKAFATLVGGLTDPGPVWLVTGSGGVGKSTLAVQAAHRVASAYPDGQLYASLRGTVGPAALPGEVLGRFLRSLGMPDSAVPDRVEDRIGQFRTLLSGRRVLLVLDDVGDEAQVRPLLPGAATCGVVLTSRSRLAGLSSIARVELDALADDAAVELLARIAGADRVAAEPEAAAEVARHCGGLPLAVRIAGARLATRRHWRVSTLAGRLADEYRRLDELRAGDLEVRATFDLSHHALDAQARTAFARLGLLGVPDFAPWVLAPLLDVPDPMAEEIGERLIDAQLLDVERDPASGQPRYRMHDLLRVYAAEQAEATQTSRERSAALSRVMGGWLWLVTQTTAAQHSGTVQAPTGGTPTRPLSPEAAAFALADPLSWFAAEEVALVAAVERAAAMDLDTPACDLAAALGASAFAVGNRFRQWSRVHTGALAATRRAGNTTGEATLLAGLGQLRYEEDRYTEAERYFRQALPLFETAGDVRGTAVVLAGLGSVDRERGRFVSARDQLTRALDGFRRSDDHAGIGHTARLAASVHLEEGTYPAARALLVESLTAYRRIGSIRGEALTLRTTGLVHRAVGDYRAAADLCAEAGEMFRATGDRLMAAYADQAMAKALVRLGETSGIRTVLSAALRECRDHSDPLGEGLVLRTLGELSLAEGRLDEAARELEAAVRIWQRLGLPLFCARAHRDLAAVHEAAGDPRTAAELRADALRVFAAFGAREHGELSRRTNAGVVPVG
ncbi:BTAD domain-containing putative transcriptional regulator [Streptomyces sp. NPDC048606]|uniref:AfsR/SARP family transcriptional regulator n=1 Tax=Streptomyces sp. NPDC048606 TaxID=3154726 RepID=UPI003441500D